MEYFCRVGRHGQVGRFASTSSVSLKRNSRVVVRTGRGIEAATILSTASERSNGSSAESIENGSIDNHTSKYDGKILRTMTAEDSLLSDQLERTAVETFATCQTFLVESGSNECLLEVEPLLDGKTLYFHFIGTPDDELNSYLKQLTEVYRAKVSETRFAQLLEHGCGPGCGTEEKGSCGESGTCTVCVIANACKKSTTSSEISSH